MQTQRDAPLAGNGGKDFRIGETGFGAGRLFAAFLDLLHKSGTSGMTITWNSVELHPLSPDRIASLLEAFRSSLGTVIDDLIQKYREFDLAAKGWQTAAFTGPFGAVTLNLWFGEALEMVTMLEVPCDAWFLDGHGPKKNPAMWRPELLTAIGVKSAPGGAIATFSVAGDVRRALEAAGFALEKVPGMGGKHWVLQGNKKS